MNEQERAEKIEYISGAIREGYEPMFQISPPELNDQQLKHEHGKAWEYYNMAADENGKPPRRDLGE